MSLLATEQVARSGRTGEAFRRHLQSLSVLANLLADSGAEDFERAADLLTGCLAGSGKVLACGNGGSAADAQHFVAELVGRMLADRPALPAVSLTSDSSVMTAIGNDYGYEEVFARQVSALGRPGDVLVALSTSGMSANVVAAVRAAKDSAMAVISLTGPDGHPDLERSDVWVRIGSSDTPHIQELHTAFIHALCISVEQSLFAVPASHFQIVR